MQIDSIHFKAKDIKNTLLSHESIGQLMGEPKCQFHFKNRSRLDEVHGAYREWSKFNDKIY